MSSSDLDPFVAYYEDGKGHTKEECYQLHPELPEKRAQEREQRQNGQS